MLLSQRDRDAYVKRSDVEQVRGNAVCMESESETEGVASSGSEATPNIQKVSSGAKDTYKYFP